MFARATGDGMPVPVLAQTGRKEFQICVPFRYRRRADEDWIDVPAEPRFATTDLASVPGFLLWLVPRYGAHTLAALLHDQLVKQPIAGGRVMADRIFRDALGELHVPLLRRWLMWAAVSLGTIFDSGILGRIKVIVWAILVAGATTTLWQHILGGLIGWEGWSWLIWGRGVPWDLLIVALAALALLPRVGVGLVAGGGIVLVLVPTVAVLITLAVYLLLEQVARALVAGHNVLRAQNTVANNTVVMSMSGPDAATAPAGCPELMIPTGKTDDPLEG